jgi:hypothetical protein
MTVDCVAADAVGSELVSPPPNFGGNRAKYRGELQNWSENTDDIINKRRFYKAF